MAAECPFCWSRGKCAKHCKRPRLPTKRKKHAASSARMAAKARQDATAAAIATAIKHGLDEDMLGRPIEVVSDDLAYVRFGCDGFVYNVCVTRSRLKPAAPVVQ